MPSDHSSSCSRSSGGTPSASPIMISGSGAAMSQTKSHSPFSQTASMISSQTERIFSSLLAHPPRREAPVDQLAPRPVPGSSMSIIIGIGPLSGRMPPALEKVFGSFDTARRSS